MFLLKFLMVMVAVAFADMCWAKYMMYAAEKNAFKAAMWGTLIMVGGMVSMISYIDDRRLIAAALIGGFCGTYFTIKWTPDKDLNPDGEDTVKPSEDIL